MLRLGLGPQIASNTPSENSLDPDAQAYFTTAGVTDYTAKIQISDFVKGIKNLNLWSSMVCWPLRSSQNAGTGTTAYSLGGLQTSNATMSGGSWTSDGFSLSGSQYGSSTLTSLNQDVTLLICAKGDGNAYGSFPMVYGIQSASTYVANEIRIGANGDNTVLGTLHRNSSTAIAYSGNGTNPLNSSTTMTFFAGNAKTATILNFKNLNTGTTVAAGTGPASAGTATLDRMHLNGRWTGVNSLANPIVCAFCAIITPNINGSESSIYSLYKGSMGSGLGLP